MIGLPHLDAGPFLSYGIQWIAFGIIAPIGVGYFVVAEVKQRRREKAHSDARRGVVGARSPPRRSSPTGTADGADRHGDGRGHRLNRARQRAPTGVRSPSSGARPSPSVGRSLECGARTASARPAARPSAPANAASTTPALGLGWRGGVAAPGRQRRPWRATDHGGAHGHQQPGRAGRAGSWPRRRIVLRPSRTAHSAATGDRSSRRACWRPGRPATPELRRAAPHHSGATWASDGVLGDRLQRGPGQPGGVQRGGVAAAQRRHQRAGPVDVVRRRGGGPCRRPCAPATCRPSATNVAAAVTATVHTAPRRAAMRSSADTRVPPGPRAGPRCGPRPRPDRRRRSPAPGPSRRVPKTATGCPRRGSPKHQVGQTAHREADRPAASTSPQTLRQRLTRWCTRPP